MSERDCSSFFDRHADKIAADPNTGCWHWIGSWVGGHKRGGTRRTNRLVYGAVRWNGRKCSAHRLAYAAANGPIPPGLLVRHKCDVPICVNPDHLEVGTHQDNVDDMLDRGRGVGPRITGKPHSDLPSIACENNGHNKLNQCQIDAIRAMRAAGVSCRKTGEVFGVSKSYVSKVARGIRWLDGGSNA